MLVLERVARGAGRALPRTGGAGGGRWEEGGERLEGERSDDSLASWQDLTPSPSVADDSPWAADDSGASWQEGESPARAPRSGALRPAAEGAAVPLGQRADSQRTTVMSLDFFGLGTFVLEKDKR
jgi:hypothetical protein